MSETADLDFSRYAPARTGPSVVWEHTDRPAPGELALLAGHARRAVRLLWQCFVIAHIVIWRRIAWRTADFCRYLLHSTEAAWTVAGLGWGIGIAFPVFCYFMRWF